MNPNWPKANQLATVYKRGRGFELGTTGEQIQLAVRAGLELGASELQVQRSNHSATLPPPNSLNSPLVPWQCRMLPYLSRPGRHANSRGFSVMSLLEHIHNTNTGAWAEVPVPDQEFYAWGMPVCGPRVVKFDKLKENKNALVILWKVWTQESFQSRLSLIVRVNVVLNRKIGRASCRERV